MYTQLWDQMNSQVSETMILRDEDQAHIPADPDNVDYVEYLAWLAEGNAPNPYGPPPIATTLPETPPLENRVAELEARVDMLEDPADG
jgi:hypothetical protein